MSTTPSPARNRRERRRPRRGSLERPVSGRMYRVTWALVALPLLVAAFTVGHPEPLPKPDLPPSFDATSAARVARDLAERFPSRVPGTAQAEEATAWVRDRLAEYHLAVEERTVRGRAPGRRPSRARQPRGPAADRRPPAFPADHRRHGGPRQPRHGTGSRPQRVRHGHSYRARTGALDPHGRAHHHLRLHGRRRLGQPGSGAPGRGRRLSRERARRRQPRHGRRTWYSQARARRRGRPYARPVHSSRRRRPASSPRASSRPATRTRSYQLLDLALPVQPLRPGAAARRGRLRHHADRGIEPARATRGGRRGLDARDVSARSDARLRRSSSRSTPPPRWRAAPSPSCTSAGACCAGSRSSSSLSSPSCPCSWRRSTSGRGSAGASSCCGPALRSYRSRLGVWLWAGGLAALFAVVGLFPNGDGRPLPLDLDDAQHWPFAALAGLVALAGVGWLVARSRLVPRGSGRAQRRARRAPGRDARPLRHRRGRRGHEPLRAALRAPVAARLALGAARPRLGALAAGGGPLRRSGRPGGAPRRHRRSLRARARRALVRRDALHDGLRVDRAKPCCCLPGVLSQARSERSSSAATLPIRPRVTARSAASSGRPSGRRCCSPAASAPAATRRITGRAPSRCGRWSTSLCPVRSEGS